MSQLRSFIDDSSWFDGSIGIGGVVAGLARTQFLTPMSAFRDEQPQDAYSKAIADLKARSAPKTEPPRTIRYSYDE